MEGLVVNKHAAHIIHRGGLDGYCAYLYIYMCHVSCVHLSCGKFAFEAWWASGCEI
jgi:hypothetical protein